jgi:Fic family protein
MSKIEQLYAEWQSLQPLKDEYQQRLNRKFMLEFNYNSNHLEGNTLTYGQTELLLLFGKVTEAANMKDLEDMKASNVGLNMMKEQALSEYPLTETFIRQLHKTLFERTIVYIANCQADNKHHTLFMQEFIKLVQTVLEPSQENSLNMPRQKKPQL